MTEKCSLVSVIIPVYNAAQTLCRCMDSVLGQTYANIEVIAVNDGSTDDSDLICREFADKDSRFIYLKKENGGVSSARNMALDCAKGEWVTFVDADDWIENTMVEEMVRQANQVLDCEISICCFSYDYTDGTLRKAIQTPAVVTKSQLTSFPLCSVAKEAATYFDNIQLGGNLGAACGKLVRTDLIKRMNLRFPLELKIAEDRYFFLNAYLEAKNFVVFNQPLYHYYVMDGSAMRSIHPEIIAETEVYSRLFLSMAAKISGRYRAIYKQLIAYDCYLRICRHWAASPYLRISFLSKYRNMKTVMHSPLCHVEGSIPKCLSSFHRFEMWALTKQWTMLLVVVWKMREIASRV